MAVCTALIQLAPQRPLTLTVSVYVGSSFATAAGANATASTAASRIFFMRTSTNEFGDYTPLPSSKFRFSVLPPLRPAKVSAMRNLLLASVLVAGCAGGSAPARPPSTGPSDLARLCEEYWEWHLGEHPTHATFLGDHRYDNLLPDYGPEARERVRRELRAFLGRARAVAPASADEAVTADILRQKLEQALAHDDHKFWQWDVDQMDGPQIWIFELSNYHPLTTEDGRRSFSARLEAFPQVIDQYIANLRAGLSEKRVATKGAVDRVVLQLRAHLERPVDKWSIAPGGDAATRCVKPALEKLLTFLEKEYAAREAVGLSSLPDGEAAYRYCIRHHTTLDLTPRELHDIGITELRSIEDEMRRIAKNTDLRDFRTRVMSDRANFPRSREEYLDGFRAILKRVDEKLPRFFARLPRAKYEVKAIEDYREKDAPAAYYYAPPADGTRNGIFYANCHKPETRPRGNMAALAAHEAVPGHHLQIAFAMELKDLPTFRRFSGFTAFVEGWALYTERLADEMGIYETDLDRYGMLTYQAWRAARLIVDTGMHALGWTRQQAIDFFVDHLALSDREIINEIDRYIIWPGQALAYKVGQREIESLRRKAQDTLGAKFRLPDFHTELLRHGAVPLPTLRMLIEKWIAAQPR